MKKRYNKQEFITECKNGGKAFKNQEIKVTTGTYNNKSIETGYLEKTGGIQDYKENAFMLKTGFSSKQIDFEDVIEVEII